MQYRTQRQTLTRRIDDPRPNDSGLITTPFYDVTPNWQSAFNSDGRTVRHGVDAAKLAAPAHTRRSRRASGQVRARQRLRGVALLEVQMPWRPTEVGADA